jgi:multidrug efflux pump subunit AcrA (membrane-fusion protein)
MSSQSVGSAGLVLGLLFSIVALAVALPHRQVVVGSSLDVVTPVEGQVMPTSTRAPCRHAAASLTRHVQLGDHVKKGQVLATLWSAELAETKSRFIAAVTSLMFEEDQLLALRRQYAAATTITQAEQRLVMDRASLERAELGLRALQLEDGEIDSLRHAAEQLHDASANHCRASNWAQWEVHCPRDGVIVRVAAGDGQTVRSGAVLFEIAEEQVSDRARAGIDQDLANTPVH